MMLIRRNDNNNKDNQGSNGLCCKNKVNHSEETESVSEESATPEASQSQQNG